MSIGSDVDQMRVSPSLLPSLMPVRPTLSSEDAIRGHLTLQRFQHAPSPIDIPELRDHVLVVNLAEPLLIAKKHPGGRIERKWAETGHVSITPSGHSLAREAMTRADLLFVHFAPSLLEEVAEDVYGVDGRRHAIVPCFAVPDPTLAALARLLMEEVRARAPGADLMSDSLGRAMALNILRRHSSLSPQPSLQADPIGAGPLQSVIDFMRRHLDEPLPLAKLASLAEASPSRFARAFRDQTGQPPHRYLLALRLERARDLLSGTDLPVIQVGFECGFEQASHFATAFRKGTGLSPRAWRKARRC